MCFWISAACQDNDIQNGGPIQISIAKVLDNFYLAENIPTKRLIPYEYVREADVVWSKRVWQYIDLREKINHSIYFPWDEYDASGNWVVSTRNYSLWVILKANVMLGQLRLFSPYNPYDFNILDGDQLKYPVDPEPGKTYLTDSIYRNTLFSYFGTLGQESTTPLANSFGEDSTRTLADGTIEYVYPARDTSWFVSKDVVQYRIKEDWFFDKERSVLDQRIIAIAPVKYQKDEEGNIQGLTEMFWLYFPHCRFVLNNYYVFNEKNDAQWMSFDDLFWKRRFNSTIYKASNVYDRSIDSYQYGVDALMQSEKVKEEIRLIEHDVWSF